MHQSPITIGLFGGAAAGLIFGITQTMDGSANLGAVFLLPVFGALVGAVLGMVFGGIFRRGD